MKLFRYTGLPLVIILLGACSKPLEWPDSPLYQFDRAGVPGTTWSGNIDSVKQQLVGHYAHYDVVAYEDTTTRTTMRTFIISYGFTDFYMEGGKLMQVDRFVRAEQKLSRKGAVSSFSEEAVQAIKPRVSEVELSYRDGKWYLYRPPTPSLLGVTGNPELPLPGIADDPNLTDPDNDGHPGVTVYIQVGKYFKGEIYITRREIFSNYMVLNNDRTISGYVVDESEQFVVGASKKILAQESNSLQHPDPGLSPVLLVPVDASIDTAEELMEIRDKIFPKEPAFYE